MCLVNNQIQKVVHPYSLGVASICHPVAEFIGRVVRCVRHLLCLSHRKPLGCCFGICTQCCSRLHPFRWSSFWVFKLAVRSPVAVSLLLLLLFACVLRLLATHLLCPQDVIDFLLLRCCLVRRLLSCTVDVSRQDASKGC